MECRPVVVELLPEKEALNLFMSKVEEGQTVLAPEVKEIARKVAKECTGLPLAIIALAGSMSGVNDIHEWKNTLNQLISSTKQISDIENVVFELLKFCYSRLKDEKLQYCFLYCALYPQDHIIPRKELTEYWISEGLITEVNSIEVMFNNGHTILNKLINTCLLESMKIHMIECVRMHDLIRDMALKITKTSPRFMVQSGEGLERVPYTNWSEELETELASFVTSQQCQALENYRLIVGNNFEYINNSVGKEVHAISFDSKPFGIGVDSLVLPSNIEYFGITRCKDLISLSDILPLRDAGHLRICLLQYCNGIESIFSSSSFSEDCQIPLRIVEELRLLDLPRFRVLFDGVVPPHNISFNLKKLYFYRCSSVKNIFPAMLQKFPNLEELTVPDCENVEDITVEVEMRYQGHHQDDSNTITL
ncbi:disease resistance protein RPS5-like [Camellia sinensis]|uniref:disease resistance protein RPS5-like n=1 Tax=Camellia sinensis TaxID=4442 RepID=UPI001036753D|nr:disease resistance protein RPS5-like [Camellia sinensis]